MSSVEEAAAAVEDGPRVKLPRAVREQQMLDAATRMFGQLGYHGVSMDQVAESIGVTKPMIYSYFGSKESLCAACITRAGEGVIGQVGLSFNPKHTPEEAQWGALTAFFEWVRDNPHGWSMVRDDLAYDNPVLRDLVRTMHDQMLDVMMEIAVVFSTATDADPFSDAVLLTRSTHAMFGAASTVADRWVADGCPSAANSCARAMMDVFWIGGRGLGEGERWSPPAARES